MCARPARDEVAERVLHRLEKLPRKPGRRRDAERVAHTGRVLRRDPSLLAGEVQRKGAALLEQLLQRRVAFEPPPQLRLGKVAEREQQIVEPVDSVRGTGQALGRVLFTKYLFPFEVASVLLIIAAIGAMVLGRRRDEEEEASQVLTHAPGAREPENVP